MAAHARGAAFENECLRVLHRWMGMRLYRTGGAGDRGMDLCGWWSPSQALGRGAPGASSAPSAERLRVIVQCKAEAKRVGPAVVRELEGTLIRASWDRLAPHGGEPAASPEKDDSTAESSQEAELRGDGAPQSVSEPAGDAFSPASAADAPLVGILASASGFSKQALLHARSSRLPLALVHFVQDEAADDGVHCAGLVWNDALGASHGLLRGLLHVSWEINTTGRRKQAAAPATRPVLFWGGVPVA